MANIYTVVKMLLAERTWGDSSRYALWAMYEEQGFDFVMGIMDHRLFVTGHIPEYRVGYLLRHVTDPIHQQKIQEKAKELGIEPKVCT